MARTKIVFAQLDRNTGFAYTDGAGLPPPVPCIYANVTFAGRVVGCVVLGVVTQAMRDKALCGSRTKVPITVAGIDSTNGIVSVANQHCRNHS
jgi:hypothetical protein